MAVMSATRTLRKLETWSGSLRRFEGHGRFVGGGSSDDADGDPAVRKGDDGEVTFKHRFVIAQVRSLIANVAPSPNSPVLHDSTALYQRWRSMREISWVQRRGHQTDYRTYVRGRLSKPRLAISIGITRLRSCLDAT